MEYTDKLNKITLEIPPRLMFTNEQETVQHLLTENYLGKGFRNCWIKSIENFTLLGSIRIPVYATAGAGLRDVEFKATVVVYEPGTVLVGCAITQNTMQNIMLRKDNLDIFIPANIQLQKFNIGQKINVIVRSAIYKDFQPMVTISADAYFVAKSVDDRIYGITTGLSLDEIEQLQALEARVVGVKSTLESHASYPFMRELFTRKGGSSSGTPVTIHDLIDNNAFDEESGMVLQRPNNIDHFSDGLIADNVSKVKPAANDTAFFVLRAGLLDQLNHVQMLAAMCETYDIDGNKDLWKLYSFLSKGS